MALGRKPYVLLVEDDPDVLRMLRTLVQPIADVETASDGLEALEKLKTGETPDLIVTDLMMPRMDGLALSRELKADPKLAKIPLIMLTAKDSAKDVVTGINAGARHYVTKPFKPHDLLAKIRKALRI